MAIKAPLAPQLIAGGVEFKRTDGEYKQRAASLSLILDAPSFIAGRLSLCLFVANLAQSLGAGEEGRRAQPLLRAPEPMARMLIDSSERARERMLLHHRSFIYIIIHGPIWLDSQFETRRQIGD